MNIILKKIVLSLLGIILATVIIGAIIFIISRRNNDSNNTGNVNAGNDAINLNTNTNDEQNANVNRNTNQMPRDENLNVNLNRNEEQNEPQEINSQPSANSEVSKDCNKTDYAGTWKLTTDVEEQTFTPPYADQVQQFELRTDGTAEFQEYYRDESGSWAESFHKGRWSVDQGCNFTYDGTADGKGVDATKNSMPFTLHYIISAQGKVQNSKQLTGTWRSSESYKYSNGDLMTQMVVGTFEATR